MCICNMDPSSDLLRRSQTTCIRNMDPSYHLLRRSQQDNDVSLSGLGKERPQRSRTDPSPSLVGVARTTGGADGYTPHNDLPSWEVGLL